jgi:hypothetical protein
MILTLSGLIKKNILRIKQMRTAGWWHLICDQTYINVTQLNIGDVAGINHLNQENCAIATEMFKPLNTNKRRKKKHTHRIEQAQSVARCNGESPHFLIDILCSNILLACFGKSAHKKYGRPHIHS